MSLTQVSIGRRECPELHEVHPDVVLVAQTLQMSSLKPATAMDWWGVLNSLSPVTENKTRSDKFSRIPVVNQCIGDVCVLAIKVCWSRGTLLGFVE